MASLPGCCCAHQRQGPHGSDQTSQGLHELTFTASLECPPQPSRDWAAGCGPTNLCCARFFTAPKRDHQDRLLKDPCLHTGLVAAVYGKYALARFFYLEAQGLMGLLMSKLGYCLTASRRSGVASCTRSNAIAKPAHMGSGLQQQARAGPPCCRGSAAPWLTCLYGRGSTQCKGLLSQQMVSRSAKPTPNLRVGKLSLQ